VDARAHYRHSSHHAATGELAICGGGGSCAETVSGSGRDLRAAADYAREHAGAADRIGMLGFSLGGHVTYFAATRLPLRAAAIYYPGWLIPRSLAG
jgi:dienelactone hydrolase